MSDEKGRATMFDDWDLKPKERARQLQGKVFELEAQNAGLVRALERIGGRCDCDVHTTPGHDCVGTIARAALAASRSLASPGDDGDDGKPDYAEAYRRWWNWASENKVAMQFVCGECGEGTKSDEDGCCASCGLTIVVAPAEGTSPPGAPAGLRPAREVAHAFESGYEDCPGQLPQSNGHSHSCDRLTAIIEADRASRPGAPMHQEAPTCGACGGSDSPPDFAGPTYKASWPCSECGRRRCCPDRCTRCAPPATEPCPCGEGGNPLHVFVHPAPKEPR